MAAEHSCKQVDIVEQGDDPKSGTSCGGFEELERERAVERSGVTGTSEVKCVGEESDAKAGGASMDSETCSLSRKEHDAGAKSESLAGENNADGVSLCTQPSFTTSCSHDSSLDGGSSAVTESLNESDRGNLKNSTEELTQRSESTSSSDDSDSEAMLCRSRSISQSVSVLPSRGSSIDISKVDCNYTNLSWLKVGSGSHPYYVNSHIGL